MKLTQGYLKRLIKEEMENGDVVTVEFFQFGSSINKNGEPVSSEDLADAFGDEAKELLSIAVGRQGGGGVDQDIFINNYLRPKMFKKKNLEDIAREYADRIGAQYQEEETSGGEDY